MFRDHYSQIMPYRGGCRGARLRQSRAFNALPTLHKIRGSRGMLLGLETSSPLPKNRILGGVGS